MSCPRKETTFKSEMEMLAMCNRNLSEKGNDCHVRRGCDMQQNLFPTHGYPSLTDKKARLLILRVAD
jgi:hypothetical protein